MLITDSMFLCEIKIDSLTNFDESNDINIQIQFTDVFSLDLAKPNEYKKPKKHRKKRKSKGKFDPNGIETDNMATLRTGRTVLFESDIATLKNRMEQYPMELSLHKRGYQDKIGSTNIPWSQAHIDYLNKILNEQEPPPITVQRGFNIFNEYTSRCMAVVNLNIKLIYIKDKTFVNSRFTAPEYVTSPSLTSASISPTKEIELAEGPGTFRTICGGRKTSSKKERLHKHTKEKRESKTSIDERPEIEAPVSNNGDSNKQLTNEAYSSVASPAKSDTDLNHHKQIKFFKTKSCTSINSKKQDIFSCMLNYNLAPLYNQIYCVNYITLQDTSKSASSKSKLSDKPSAKTDESNVDGSGSEGIDLDKFELVKCDRVQCNNKEYRKLPEPVDERILLDLANLEKKCCTNVEEIKSPHSDKKVEEVVGEITAKIKTVGGDPCYCECECKFGFVKRTTYCEICGGYEMSGEELARRLPINMPHPCPIFHNLVDKTKPKQDTKGDVKRKGKLEKSDQGSDSSKKGKKHKNDKFKFNFGYTAPQIGHSNCGAPCTGTLENVPKTMGWLWTAGNVPGLKFRPAWKPGAISKSVLRKLRIAKNPEEATKKKKVHAKAVKKLKRPLLVIHKQDGEYTVTMETMKQYAKPRMINQQPYEDKPVLTYTIGRTEEENIERRKKKEREQRRLERAQRHFIESTFSDLCKDICLKTYHQAIGVMPYDEIPDCSCCQVQPSHKYCDLEHSCSCSEESLTDTDFTDSDEWILEFTPPNALFDPLSQVKKVVYVDNTTQYTYLDYRVKLLDRFGNQVPRYFKGPDGKKECSDLGGFWGPDKTWLEINVDGIIGQDEKWAPVSFIGPYGDTIDAPTGRFQITGGVWLEVGVDGFIDAQGKFKYYPNRKQMAERKVKAALADTKKKGSPNKKEVKVDDKQSQTEWSCFGDVTPRHLSEMGIVGHGHDKKLLLKTLKAMVARGENVRIPSPSTVPRMKTKGKRRRNQSKMFNYEELLTCKHPIPSSKGVVAVDDLGNKAYFKMKEPPNKRYKERLTTLANQGISMSSFHVPCLDSYSNCAKGKRHQTTQAGYRERAREVTDDHKYKNVVV